MEVGLIQLLDAKRERVLCESFFDDFDIFWIHFDADSPERFTAVVFS
jgi:hypothetical protein